MQKLLLSLLLSSITFINAEIVTCKTVQEMKEVLQKKVHHSKKSYLFSDLDDTLLRPESHVGSTEWFMERVALHKHSHTPEKSIELAVVDLASVYETIKVMPVENDTISFINTLKKEMTAFGLTARSAHFNEVTIKHLNAINFAFDNHPLSFNLNGDCPVHYHEGIFYCGKTSKANVLKQVLEQCKNKPEYIVFIDDSLSHVKAIDAAMLERNMPCLSIHYTYAQDTKNK